jgi:hypothetical protein
MEGMFGNGTDYQGEFLPGNRQYCYTLTVTEHASLHSGAGLQGKPYVFLGYNTYSFFANFEDSEQVTDEGPMAACSSFFCRRLRQGRSAATFNRLRFHI